VGLNLADKLRRRGERLAREQQAVDASSPEVDPKDLP